ncbi:hypothetical protein GT755_36115 [Herbidospora sp. NEAU-GS84]|uniref:Uncharacterized protein n=1 Tax=Herbidospora solisilvae TaxID=2696284 RepID=A0A7C9J8W0_9ACTN|nr:hypothetical protein [Herbidospora solisilvae]NAS27080.1 hypothetical protein [Herbidospora solisilvae]
MIAAAWSAVGGAVLLLIGVANLSSVAISPDGHRYLAAGAGRPVPHPFAGRWLLPRVLGAAPGRWQWSTRLHLLALPPLTTLWLEPWIADQTARTVGGLMVCGLTGLWRSSLFRPVLVEAPAMAWSLGCAVLLQHGWWAPALAAAIVAAAIKETSPLFAACFAWHPLPLAALAVSAGLRLAVRTGPDPMGEEELLAHPVRTGLLSHMDRWFSLRELLLPWGAGTLALLAVDASFTPMLVTAVVIGYGQLLVATGTVRLYQWAFPPVLLGAVSVIPPRWLVAALAVHLLNPWAGPGR